MTALVAADYRGALDFLRVLHGADGAGPFPAHVLAALRRLIPSAIGTYHEWDPAEGYRWTLDGAADADVRPVWSRYPDVMAQDPFPGGGPRAVGMPVAKVGEAFRFSDVLTLSQFKRLDLHAEICRPLGIDHVMKVFLAVGESGASFVLDSQRRPFSERDRELLEALAPHLTLARRRGLARLGSSAAFEGLSPRERDVLRLVADGMTNREIGVALFIATGTVRKHLENIYAKLGVRSRAQAIAVAGGLVTPEQREP